MFLPILISLIYTILFTKQLLFWLWLWQLKDYHWGRFKAHFETQRLKKIASSFWRLKYPRFTKKAILLSILGFIIGILLLKLSCAHSIYLASLTTAYSLKIELQQYFQLWSFCFLLLFVIFLLPVIVSLMVLIFQIPTIILRNRILAKAAKKREQFKDLTVIGITGSYGKTSTKEFLYTFLSEKFGSRVLKTKEHVNAEIGIAKTILQDLNETHKIFIAEIGAYERGKIKQVCKMLKPQIGILTGINEQHMSTFGSQENIVKAKFELIENLPKQGIAITNRDNQYIISNQSQSPNVKKIFCSAEKMADVWAENVKMEKEKIFFIVHTHAQSANQSGNNDNNGDIKNQICNFYATAQKLQIEQFDVNTVGRQNVINVLMAVASAQELGMNLTEIAKASEKIKSPIQIQKNKQGLNIIDNTYSANPDGVISHLEYLKTAWQRAKKILVMPCLIELGKASKEVHYRIGKKIAEVCDLAIITTKDRFKELKRGALSAGMEENKILLAEKPEQILDKIKYVIRDSADNVILLEGRISLKLFSTV